jgi:2-polyprenyl-6-methoxyphenol hydroxylase-like FAD-dependent oxidoreductase
MHVLIAGAGIAGLTLALALERAGHRPEVVEKAPGPRGGGYMVDFYASGYDAAEALGLHAALEAIHYPIAEIVEVDRQGRTKSAIDYRALRQLLHGRHYNFQRGDLERVLLDQVHGRVPIRYGTTVDAFTPTPDGVEATLSDGSQGRWDLLVGAEGIHSRIRAQLFGDEGQFSHFLGMRVAAYHLDAVPPALEGWDAFPMLTTVDRLMGLYPTRAGRLAVFLLYRVDRPLTRGETRDPCAELERNFRDLGWLAPEVLAGCRQDPEPYFDDVSQISLPTWHAGHVVLVGDACQAVSLVAGQGASLAMAGAVILAEELGRGEDVPAALDRYQRRVQPFVAVRQANARKFARWFLPDSRWRLALRDLAMSAARLPFGDRLVLQGFDTESLFRRRS